jgi:hypothetical protein
MSTLHHQEYLNSVYTPLLASSRDHASRRQQTAHDKYLGRVYTVETLLMMDSGHVRNM